MTCGFQAWGFMPPCVLDPGHAGDHSDGFGGFYGRDIGTSTAPPDIGDMSFDELKIALETDGPHDARWNAVLDEFTNRVEACIQKPAREDEAFLLTPPDAPAPEARTERKPPEPIKAKQVDLFEPQLF